MVWAALSSLWSPWDGETNVKIVAMLGLGLLFGSSVVTPQQARWTLAGASAALLVLILLIVIEAMGDSSLNRAANPTAGEFAWTQNPARGAVVMLALLWPATAWMLDSKAAWRWLAIASFLAGAVFVALQFDQLSNLLGLCIGAAFFAFGLAAPRLAILIPAFGLAAWLAMAPFAMLAVVGAFQAPAWLPHSWDVRLGIWRYTSERALEQPWLGHGLDAARSITEMTVYDGEALRVIPVHPHNASLQIWYETGVIGVVLGVALLVWLGLRLSRAYATARPQAAAAAAVLAMFGAMANIGWSLWQEWWMATIILAAILVAALGNQTPRRNT
ncbi:MAG: O-antigen ligase family protein [Terricaulis sp.]